MLKTFTSDAKQILREPIMLLLFFVPLIIYLVFKFIIMFLIPVIDINFGINFMNYKQYILAIAVILGPEMLGTVTGFLMIDDRDARITELMYITPVGYKGYIINRLSLPFIFGVIYTFICYSIINIVELNIFTIGILAILSGIEGIIIGSLLFKLAEDKVKGLVIAKALSGVMLFSLADILGEKWISLFASIFPFYWISKVICVQNINSIVIALLIHVVWLLVLIKWNDK